MADKKITPKEPVGGARKADDTKAAARVTKRVAKRTSKRVSKKTVAK